MIGIASCNGPTSVNGDKERKGSVYAEVAKVTKAASGQNLKPSGKYTRAKDREATGHNAEPEPDDMSIPF
jgi:hypothetical protein